MAITDKPLDSVNEADLQSLIGNERETKTMEFKLCKAASSRSQLAHHPVSESSVRNTPPKRSSGASWKGTRLGPTGV